MAQFIKQYDEVLTKWQFSIDISEATSIRFLMNSSRRPTAPVVDKVAQVDPLDDTVVLVTLTTAETSIPGRYNVEFETTWADGQVITFPNKGYERLVILPDLGGVEEESSV